jgi:rubredoxin
MSYHQCPVCGFQKMTHPPNDYYICPCCATEFEADDFETTYEQLRDKWLKDGAKWFSRVTPEPHNWSPYTQLANLDNKTVRVQSTFKPNPINRLYLGSSYRTVKATISYTVDSHWEIVSGGIGVSHA